MYGKCAFAKIQSRTVTLVTLEAVSYRARVVEKLS